MIVALSILVEFSGAVPRLGRAYALVSRISPVSGSNQTCAPPHTGISSGVLPCALDEVAPFARVSRASASAFLKISPHVHARSGFRLSPSPCLFRLQLFKKTVVGERIPLVLLVSWHTACSESGRRMLGQHSGVPCVVMFAGVPKWSSFRVSSIVRIAIDIIPSSWDTVFFRGVFGSAVVLVDHFLEDAGVYVCSAEGAVSFKCVACSYLLAGYNAGVVSSDCWKLWSSGCCLRWYKLAL